MNRLYKCISKNSNNHSRHCERSEAISINMTLAADRHTAFAMTIRVFRDAHKLLFFILLIPFLVSCGNFDRIVIGEPQELKVQGFEDNSLKILALVPVSNPTLHRIIINEIDVRVFLNDEYIGKLLVDEQIVIKAKEEKMYELPVKIRLANILNTAFLMINLKKGQKAQFRFEGVVKVRTLIIKKEIPINQSYSINM